MATTTAAPILPQNRELLEASASSVQAEREAPEEFWRRLDSHRQALIQQAHAIVGSREDAEDVVQETFLEAARQTIALPARGLCGWLRAVNRTNAVDRLRGKRSDSRRQQACSASEETFTTGGFSRMEMREALQRALAGLTPELRAVVRLRFFEHRSYKQIAETIGVPMGSVNALLMDASAALYARLKA